MCDLGATTICGVHQRRFCKPVLFFVMGATPCSGAVFSRAFSSSLTGGSSVSVKDLLSVSPQVVLTGGKDEGPDCFSDLDLRSFCLIRRMVL